MIAIDLGSNTLRVLQLECQTGKFIASFERIVKTADGLAHSGRVNKEATQRVIDAINEAKIEIDFSSGPLRAVTTEALRRASNSDEVLAEILKETGIEFEVITGEEEARLTLLAVQNRVQLLEQKKEETFLLIDIGGGSTELILRYPEKVVTRSFPVGIVTIVQSHSTLEAIEEAIPDEMVQMLEFVREIYQKEGRVDAFVATAGTPTTVAAMKWGQTYATYDPEVINGTTLCVADLESALHRLLSMPFEDREKHVGVGRSDLITAGILIFRQLFLIAEMQECVVIDDSLREGVALQGCRDIGEQGKKLDF